MAFRVVGMPVQRKEVFAKLTGSAEYVDDVCLPGLLHGLTIRSTVPHGRILSIDFQPGVPWDQFVVVRARDIPGRNVVTLINDDQPYLADEFVNHLHEPVLLLAHRDQDVLRKARGLVRIEYESLPAVLRIEDSTEVVKRYRIDKGDVDPLFAQAAFVVDGEYSTGAQEHVYIETNGMVAQFDPHEGVTVRGSLQCPFYVQKALMALFALPAEKVRIVQQDTGGAFGGKEEYPSMIGGHAALLAWKSGCPVKLIYDREEDMAATTKRHPSRTRHRTAVDSDGHLLAMDIEFTLDAGAYSTLSAVVLSRGTIHAAGPYRCENVRVTSTAWATHTPPHGAFRGFGAPQSLFALERHMDRVARAVGLSPEEFRKRNLLCTGDTSATGQTMVQPLDLAGLQRRALEAAGFDAKTKQFADSNKKGYLKRGIGFATFMHGAGFTGSGERYLQSVARLQTTEDGNVRILASMTEMGQGTNTILTQIVAEALSIDYSQVEMHRPDTAMVPNSGPTVASRTSMIVGRLLEHAADELKQKLELPAQYSPGEFKDFTRQHFAQHGPLVAEGHYQEPPGVHWDDSKYRGDAYGAYSWATYVAEVTVDTLTGQVTVDDFVAMQEIGKVLHPVLASGQIEGGVVQGIGWALYENVQWKGGGMVNNQLTNYIIPTSMDVPPIQVLFEEVPYEHGAMGAKGIGELPMDGPAPALLNAIHNALGVDFFHIPLMPEDILSACKERGE
jgi:CO/xanthine dehydrogenase Mo-binding subunit